MLFLVSLIPLLLPVAAAAQERAGPSPLLTRAEREAFLQRASIGEPDAPSGTKQSWRARLDDGTHTHAASVETATASGPSQPDYRFNVAAYELAKALELNLVAPSVERTVKGQPASVTWWVDDVAMDEVSRRRKSIEPPDADSWNTQMSAVRVFDELVANGYRKMEPASYTSTIWDNLLITRDWTIWLIDHTRTFGTRRQLEHVESLTRCDRTLLGRLRALNKELFAEKLGRYLSPEQIEALEARRALLVKHFDDQIARRGAGAVLYDLPPRQR